MASKNTRKLSVVLSGICLFLSACTSTAPVELEELVDQGSEHWERVRADAEKLSGPLSLDEALALGLRRNLDLRLKALDATLSRSDQRLTSWEMLPSLTASAGYRYRDRVQASYSSSQLTDDVSATPSTAVDRRRRTGSLDLSWNMLDMGLAWLAAKGQGDKALMEDEKLRRLIHSVTRDIVYAWDQALAYQRVVDELEAARELTAQALERSRQLEDSRLWDPVRVLEYRKSLIVILKEINRLRRQARQARDELARMLDFPAGVEMELDVDSDLLAGLPELSATLEQWQMAALLNRPEVRAAFYGKRGADRSGLERMLRLFPSVAFNYGYQYDSNSFLLHNNWSEAGARMSWDLLKLASWPDQRRRARLEKKKADLAARLKMTAVLSQVAIAGKQLGGMRENRCLGQQLLEIESRRVGILSSRQAQAALDRLTLIKARLEELLVRLETSLDRADHRRSLLMLLSSSGVGITPERLEGDSMESVATDIRRWVTGGLQQRINEMFSQVETHFDPVGSDNIVRFTTEICEP